MRNPKIDTRVLGKIDPYSASTMQLFRFFLSFLLPHWHLILLIFFLLIMSITMAPGTIFFPRVTAHLIDNVFPLLPERNWNAVTMIALMTLALVLFEVVSRNMLDFLTYILTFRVGITLSMVAFRRLHGLSLAAIEKRPVGEHIYRMGTNFDPQRANSASVALAFGQYGTAAAEDAPRIGHDIDVVLLLVTQIFEMSVRIATSFLVISGMVALMIGPEVGIALLLFAIPYVIGVHVLYSFQRQTEMRLRHLSENYLAEMQRALAAIRTVKAYGKTRFHLLRFTEKFVIVCRRQGWYFFLKLITDNYIMISQWLFVLTALFYSIAFLRISEGEIVALYGFLHGLFTPVQHAVRVMEGVRIQMVAARRLMETLAARDVLSNPEQPIPSPSAPGPVRIDRVSFSYVPGHPVLRDADLVFQAGKKHVIVGPSGSGKSSLVNLVLRFYDPDTGTVSIDGVDLKQIDLQSFYDRIGMILQDDFLFTGTIRENIQYGKRLATQEEIEWACRVAGVHDEIMAMPDRYETHVGQGSGLSGGQMQRVALARAFVKKPSILILDEATRALDARLHRVVLRNVDREFSRATRIFVSHATRDARNADMVYYLENGRMKESGDYQSLMNLQGGFATLVNAEKSASDSSTEPAE